MKIKFTDTETFIISSDSEDAKVILDKLIFGLTIQKGKLKLLSTPCPDGTKSLMIGLEREALNVDTESNNQSIQRQATDRINQLTQENEKDTKHLNDRKFFDENCCGFGIMNYRP